MTRFYSLLLVVALMMSGCVSTSAPVPPDSLNHFRDTLVDLNVNSIKAIDSEYDWNYRNFKTRIKTEDKTSVEALTLDFCPGVYDWQWGECDVEQTDVLVFNTIAGTKVKLAEINQAMIDYANFLIQFNGANEKTKANLDEAAKKIGAATKSISSNFDVTLNEANFGAFASIGVGIVEQLLARKQREGMAAVMVEFQPGVSQFANLGSGAMVISALGIQDEYKTEVQPLARAVNDETNGAKRLVLIEKLLALNERTGAHLNSLGNLGAAYEALPNAHAELMAALEAGTQASMAELVGHIEMISTAAQTLKNSGDE